MNDGNSQFLKVGEWYINSTYVSYVKVAKNDHLEIFFASNEKGYDWLTIPWEAAPPLLAWLERYCEPRT